MARTQAKILTAIWTDPDWLDLSAEAQRLYILLLSQPKLTLAGCLDVMPARWARLAPDTTTETVTAALGALARARFVVVDDDELVVRTLVANDIATGATNSNLIKGMWAAWASIMSPKLRKVVVDEMPDAVFDREGVEVPDEAVRMRQLPHYEPQSEPRFEPQPQPQSEPESEPSVVGIPTRSTANTPAASLRTTPRDDEQDLRKAAALVAQRIASAEATGNPDALAASIAKDILQGPDPTRRERIKEILCEGYAPEALAEKWGFYDPLAGALYPPKDRAVPERHGPKMAEFKGWDHHEETTQPDTAAALIEGARKALATGEVTA